MNYPHLAGNVPKTPSYGVYTSQLVRLCDINDAGKYFINDVKHMNNKLLKQGFSKELLCCKYVQFCNRYIYKWCMLDCDISSAEIVDSIFS